VVYIGLKGEALSNRLKDRYRVFDAVYAVPAGKFRRYHGESLLSHLIDIRTLALNIADFFRVLAGIGYSRRLLKQLEPQVVFSKGGFVAVPVGLAAATRRIPIVTHDSDTVPGLANRIIGRFAQIHATGMPSNQSKYQKAGLHYVGIPLDERIKPVTKEMQASFKKQLGLAPNDKLLLVGGAGLGAKDVNDKLIAIAPQLLERFDDLQIVHLAGAKHKSQVKSQYQAALPTETKRVKVMDFTPEFYKYSGASDLIITRAGATTIAELAVQRKVVILIPATHLSSGHQLKNANELQRQHAALVVSNEAEPQELFKAVTKALEDKSLRQELASNLGSLAKVDAADRLADLLLQIAKK
jgi:UDP-N-acetylglucosamine--N-acetylmuramyl-(pentapeptide) pyrophosphoryl-undecaprenol N-acetylglucosamine transferase